ncbi:tetratricopeptide (TPR) repeat protein [Catenuloplanes nepalensis]|uniref:Tetratricopeptide (TPR) repeat protein n=1 Tax=Catenuloplanes nepalensis TaxID=587533 RepID=A0ABT9MWR3_9ACTN|nr:tetratricopeptide repeat protein [Catenuloplanes nepalensis]MDP9795877.1 tetratricopeptide (TPR) repeat protein [Catenuloplanes nepalensis]
MHAIPDPTDDSTRSEVSGQAGDVVQARDVHGGVHFHGPGPVARATAPRQLPADVRGFVNRHAELDLLDSVIGTEPPTTGIYVLAGTAGVGKTSLAIHWAHQVRHQFPDGQLCVNLRGYDPGPPLTPAEVLDRFLRALDVPVSAIPTTLEDRAALFRTLLAERRMLILLDNAATTAQVRPLLPGTDTCLVLVTTRSRLSGLAARDGARRLTLDLLPETDAVTLLRALTSGYRADDDSPGAYEELAQLCARLPLALRIAAERAASRPRMPLTDLIRDLRDESALWDALTAEDSDEADAVRTVFAWSYRALTEPAARLFRFLGLHPGAEFSTEAAAALAGAPVPITRQHLDLLVGTHLIEQTAAGRYQFHDLLRAYAIGQAQEEPAELRTAALRRVVSWYLHAADIVEQQLGGLDLRIPIAAPPAGLPLPSFGDRPSADRWLETERGNLLAAIRAAAADPHLHDLAWRLAAVLRGYYMRENVIEDWFTATRLGLEAATVLGDRRGEAELYDSLGIANVHAHRLADALVNHTEALRRRRALGDRLAEAVSLNAIGLTELRARRLDHATGHFRQSIEIFHELRDAEWAAVALANLGEAQYESGDLDDAAESVQRALADLRAANDVPGVGNALRLLCVIRREQGRLDDALTAGHAAVEVAVTHRNLFWQGYWLIDLGAAQASAGLHDDALATYQRAATIQRRLGDRSREGLALAGAAATYRRMGRDDDAVDMYRGAVTVLRSAGDRWQLMSTLHQLAAVLADIGAQAQAVATWHEALTHGHLFTDQRARRLHDHIERRAGAE